MNPGKPGYKTTEFWLALAAIIVGAALASGAITNALVLQALGVAATVLGSLGYHGLRYATKGGEAKAAAEIAKTLDPTRPPQS